MKTVNFAIFAIFVAACSIGLTLLERVNATKLNIRTWPFRFPYRESAHKRIECQLGDEPLLLSNYIHSNNSAQGRLLSRVTLPTDAGKFASLISYSGFITVNKTDPSSTFFWLFETTNNTVKRTEDRPLIIWLAGGPGDSSLISALTENGPFAVHNNGSLYQRHQSWTDIGNMLYVDNPVGTGFSFTTTDDGYARDETQIGKNLYSFIVQFYQIFPQYKKTPLYITGESYAGKYIPAFAYRVYKENFQTSFLSPNYVPLVGISIGDALVDSENMIEAYGPLLYNLGLFDQVETEYVNNQSKVAKRLIQQGKFIDAFNALDFYQQSSENSSSFFTNATGSTNVYNALEIKIPDNYAMAHDSAVNYLLRCDVRKALHVGNVTYKPSSDKVLEYLYADLYDTVRQWVPTVFDNYRTLLFNGEFDILVGLPLTELWLSRLYLSPISWWLWYDYTNSRKTVWRINGRKDINVAGYVKTTPDNRFHLAVIRGAGHFTLYDQPERVFDVVQRFVNHQPYTN